MFDLFPIWEMVDMRIVSAKLWALLLCICISFSHGLLANDLANLVTVEGFAKGSAYTADTQTLESIYKNPSLLWEESRPSLLVSYANYFDGLFSSLGVQMSKPISFSKSIGLAIPLKIIANNLETIGTTKPEVIGQFSDIEGQAIFSYAQRVHPALTLGLNTHIDFNKIHTESALGWGFTAGAYTEFNETTLGASIENIVGSGKKWSTGHQDVLEQTIHLGFRSRLMERTFILGDIDIRNDYEFNAGAEINLAEGVFIYCGVKDITQTQQYTAGTSIDLRSLKLVYAVGNHEFLGLTHKFSIQLRKF